MAEFFLPCNYNIAVSGQGESIDMRVVKNELRRSIDDFAYGAYETPAQTVDAARVLLTLATLEPLCKLFPVRDRLDAIDQILEQLHFREPTRITALLASIEILAGKDCLEMSMDEKMIRYIYIASDLHHTINIFKDYRESCSAHVKHLMSLADKEKDSTGHSNHKMHAMVKLCQIEHEGYAEVTDSLAPIIDKTDLTINMLYELSRMSVRAPQVVRPNA